MLWIGAEPICMLQLQVTVEECSVGLLDRFTSMGRSWLVAAGAALRWRGDRSL